MFAPDTLVCATKENVFCELDGESVILNMADGVYYGLNAVGHRIWEFIQQPRRLNEITAALEAEFEVETEQCRADVVELLSQLAEKGLVTIDDSPTS